MAQKITPERREQRKKLLALLQDAGVNDVEGVQELFKEMVGTVLENGLEGELDESSAIANTTTTTRRQTTAGTGIDQLERRHRRKDTVHVRQGHEH